MPTAQINDFSLYYELRGAGGEPVILIHGAQGDARLLEPFVPWLSDRYQLLLFDQRGLGRSGKPDVPYSTALIADDTAKLMDVVGWASAHVVGVSMGGMVAQELALNHPAECGHWSWAAPLRKAGMMSTRTPPTLPATLPPATAPGCLPRPSSRRPTSSGGLKWWRRSPRCAAKPPSTLAGSPGGWRPCAPTTRWAAWT